MKIRPYSKKPVTIYKWHPRYLQIADSMKTFLSQRIADVKIYHFGSTSIPGCDGKDILDFILTYKKYNLNRIKKQVDHLGFQKQISRNPFPESRPMRTGSVLYKGRLYRIHLHIICEQSSEIDRILSFRDILIDNPALKQQYINLKHKIVKRGILDPTDYCQAKKSFIDSVHRYPSTYKSKEDS